MVMIDFVKMTNDLFVLDIFKISIVGFIFFSLIMGILADIIDQKDLSEDLGVISRNFLYWNKLLLSWN